MMKILGSLSVSFLAFLAIYLLLNCGWKEPGKIVLVMDAVVPSDETFQLHYRLVDEKDYRMNDAIETRIKGDERFQKISFSIPSIESIDKIEIVATNDKGKREILIRSIKLKTQRKTSNYVIPGNFENKAYSKLENGVISIEIDNIEQRPILVADFNIKRDFKDLREEQAVLPFWVTVIIAGVLSVSVFLFIYYNSINVESIRIGVYVLAFFLILSTPFFVEIFHLKTGSEINEKRRLAKRPKFRFSEDYPREFEMYYDDNFGLRPLLVNWNSDFKLNSLKVSPRPNAVLIGGDGFMFYNQSGSMYNCYTNLNVVDREELEKSYQRHIALKRYLKKGNIDYIVGFFPNKHTIHKEHLPFSMRMQIVGDTTLADQMVDFFQEKEFPFLDFREELNSEKKERRIYYKFDTHWNTYGAYTAYKAFCEKTFNVLGLTSYDITEFDVKYKKIGRGDLTRIMGIKEMKSYYDEIPIFELKDNALAFERRQIKGYPYEIILTENEKVDNQDTALIFRDSYTHALIPFLSLHFRKVFYVSTHNMDKRLIEEFKPDVVMWLGVERNLPRLLLN